MSRLEQRFATLHALCHDARIADMARGLLGGEAELMKDKYIFKAAGQGQFFTPHQDMQCAWISVQCVRMRG